MVEARSKPASQDSSRIRFQDIFEQVDLNQRKTSIVGTLGPSCYDADQMGKMLDAGMNICRLNFAFGDHKSHGHALKQLSQLLHQRQEQSLAIMLDTKGPSMLTGSLKEGKPVELKAGQTYQIVIDSAIEGDATRVSTNYRELPETVQLGSKILIDNGGLECEVTEVAENGVMVEIKNNYILGEKKVMHLPGASLDMSVLTDKDELDINEFAVKNNVDMVAVSLIRTSDNVETVRDLLKASPTGENIKIIAKVENLEGLQNFEEILAAADGVMIMRQSIALELPPEKLIIAQRWMIQRANLAAKPIFCAQQVFDSMIEENNRPTDQEASDVSRCILDGTDAILLNEETSNGEFPVNAVSFLSKICAEAERCIDYKATYLDLKKMTTGSVTPSEGLAAQTVKSSQNLSVDLIICHTQTGQLPRYVAKYRPAVPILACCDNPQIIKQLAAMRGVIGFHMPPSEKSNESLIAQALSFAKENSLCKAGRKVIYLHGMMEDRVDEFSMKEIIDIE